MRIDRLNQVSNIYNKQMTNMSKSNQTSKKDQAVFSEQAISCQKAYKAAKSAPDIRTDKVNQIKEQIKSGTYNVSAREVSEKIINELDLRG